MIGLFDDELSGLKEKTSMSIIKIMPCLDMKDGRVVKGINFINLKDAGNPVENAALYEKEGADELAMLDIAATVENQKTRSEWMKKVPCKLNSCLVQIISSVLRLSFR